MNLCAITLTLQTHLVSCLCKLVFFSLLFIFYSLKLLNSYRQNYTLRCEGAVAESAAGKELAHG